MTKYRCIANALCLWQKTNAFCLFNENLWLQGSEIGMEVTQIEGRSI
jgi:hypothetical protein